MTVNLGWPGVTQAIPSAIRTESNTMKPDEVRALNEENVYALMRNEAVPADLRLQAAVVLYERGSKFTHAPEFRPFKPRVLDHLLANFVEHPPIYGINAPYEAMGRLHEHVELLGKSHAEVSQRHEKIIHEHKKQAETAALALSSRLESHQAEQAKIDKTHTVVQARIAVNAAEDLVRLGNDVLTVLDAQSRLATGRFGVVERALHELRWVLATLVALGAGFGGWVIHYFR